MQPVFFTISEKEEHKSFVWEYIDRGISKSSKGVTVEAKCKNCATLIKPTGCSIRGLLHHPKSKHSMEKPCSTPSDISGSTQSASCAKRFKSAYSQATLHSFMNNKTKKLIDAKLVAVDGFPNSAICKNEFICLASRDTKCIFQNI